MSLKPMPITFWIDLYDAVELLPKDEARAVKYGMHMDDERLIDLSRPSEFRLKYFRENEAAIHAWEQREIWVKIQLDNVMSRPSNTYHPSLIRHLQKTFNEVGFSGGVWADAAEEWLRNNYEWLASNGNLP